jgi:hypothetical protein
MAGLRVEEGGIEALWERRLAPAVQEKWEELCLCLVEERVLPQLERAEE